MRRDLLTRLIPMLRACELMPVPTLGALHMCCGAARLKRAGLCGPQNLYGMSPVNYYARCNPSPLAGVAQGIVQPGDTVPAGKRPPGQARAPKATCSCPWCGSAPSARSMAPPRSPASAPALSPRCWQAGGWA